MPAKKRKCATPTQDLIVATLKQHGPMTPQDIAPLVGHSDVRLTHKTLKRCKGIHICDWRPRVGSSGPAAPVWKYGKGKDAPKPEPFGKAVYNARHKEKCRAAIRTKSRASRGFSGPVWLIGLAA